MREIFRSILGIAIAGGALLLSLSFQRFSFKPSVCPFFLATIVSVWYLGIIPGISCAAASILSVNYFLVDPPGFAMDRDEIPRFIFFSATVALIAWFAAARRRAERAAREAVELLEAEVEDRTMKLEREISDRRAAEDSSKRFSLELEIRKAAEAKKETEIRYLRTHVEALTERELEIFKMVAEGLQNKHIAKRLGLAEVTVKVHRKNVMRKMGARTLADLVRRAERLGVGGAS